MANISVNTTELLRLLDITPAHQNIMLVGNHGIGKSEILTEHFASKGMKVVPLFLGQMSDPGDLIGIPNRNEATGKTEFMPPWWFPLDGKPIVLFLDELNRARPEVLQTIMDLALNRTLAGRSLPEGSRIISAVNAGDQYQLTDLDPALVSRFNVMTFHPTVQEWLLWADKNGVDARVKEFIRENPIWLDKDPDAKEGADTGLDKTPDRRGWKRVSDILLAARDTDPVVTKAISGIVGPKAAAALVGSTSPLSGTMSCTSSLQSTTAFSAILRWRSSPVRRRKRPGRTPRHTSTSFPRRRRRRPRISLPSTFRTPIPRQ